MMLKVNDKKWSMIVYDINSYDPIYRLLEVKIDSCTKYADGSVGYFTDYDKYGYKRVCGLYDDLVSCFDANKGRFPTWYPKFSTVNDYIMFEKKLNIRLKCNDIKKESTKTIPTRSRKQNFPFMLLKFECASFLECSALYPQVVETDNTTLALHNLVFIYYWPAILKYAENYLEKYPIFDHRPAFNSNYLHLRVRELPPRTKNGEAVVDSEIFRLIKQDSIVTESIYLDVHRVKDIDISKIQQIIKSRTLFEKDSSASKIIDIYNESSSIVDFSKMSFLEISDLVDTS